MAVMNWKKKNPKHSQPARLNVLARLKSRPEFKRVESAR